MFMSDLKIILAPDRLFITAYLLTRFHRLILRFHSMRELPPIIPSRLLIFRLTTLFPAWIVMSFKLIAGRRKKFGRFGFISTAVTSAGQAFDKGRGDR